MHQCACSWLPLYLGDATLYLDACPHMSFFLAGALLTLGVNLLHTFSMPLAFSGWMQGLRRRWVAVPIAHLTAALLVRLCAICTIVLSDTRPYILFSDAVCLLTLRHTHLFAQSVS